MSEYLTEEQTNEYIRRGDALECEIRIGAPRGHKEVVLQVAQAIVDHIKSVPAADVVEVVRCKDCKWYHESFCVEPVHCPWEGRTTKASRVRTDFCSYGERKEQEHEDGTSSDN